MEFIRSYSIQNDREFLATIRRFRKAAKDLRIAFREIVRDWMKSNQEQFNLKGSGKYPPLDPDYAAYKREKYGPLPIMVLTGRLRDSLSGNRPNKDTISKIGKQTLAFGTKVEYAIYHQSDRPRTKIPQRKVLFINDSRLNRFKNIIEGEVFSQMRAKGHRVQ